MTTRHSLTRIVMVAGGSAVLALGGAGSAAAVGGGNSGAAKACQKGGWETLVRADGSAFRTTGDCVSYRARGGAFGSSPQDPDDPGESRCQTAEGYYFEITGQANEPESGRVWRESDCTGDSVVAHYLTGGYESAFLACLELLNSPAGGNRRFVSLSGDEEWGCWDATPTEIWYL